MKPKGKMKLSFCTVDDGQVKINKIISAYMAES